MNPLIYGFESRQEVLDNIKETFSKTPVILFANKEVEFLEGWSQIIFFADNNLYIIDKLFKTNSDVECNNSSELCFKNQIIKLYNNKFSIFSEEAKYGLSDVLKMLSFDETDQLSDDSKAFLGLIDQNDSEQTMVD